MKKILIVLCLMGLCFSLAACDPGSETLDEGELSLDLTAVELVFYENPEQEHFSSWVPDHSEDLRPFVPENMRVLQRLDTEKQEDFLRQLSQEEILSAYYAYDSPAGYCLKLTYANGEFLILNCNTQSRSHQGYIGSYSAEGEVLEFIGCFASYYSFEALVADYFADTAE